MTKPEWIKYIGVLGVALAIVSPLLATYVNMELAWAGWVIALSGLVVAFTLKPNVSLFVAGLSLLAVAGLFAVLPMVGELAKAMLTNLALFGGAMISVPAIRVALKQVGIKF